MGENEVATVRTLTAYREVMATLIRERRGRVVDASGDNLLAEFASVVDAVECAAEIQRELKSRNAQLPVPRRLEFRIGINLGDVIVEGERIYGDGVNIAARVEGLAEAGGISSPARSMTRSRTSSRARTSLWASTSLRTSWSRSGSIGSCSSPNPLARIRSTRGS